jgi:hypothetical protein
MEVEEQQIQALHSIEQGTSKWSSHRHPALKPCDCGSWYDPAQSKAGACCGGCQPATNDPSSFCAFLRLLSSYDGHGLEPHCTLSPECGLFFTRKPTLFSAMQSSGFFHYQVSESSRNGVCVCVISNPSRHSVYCTVNQTTENLEFSCFHTSGLMVAKYSAGLSQLSLGVSNELTAHVIRNLKPSARVISSQSSPYFL